MTLEINLGDILNLKKKHPCGGNEWQVFRLGADIGIQCLTCGHRLLMSHAVLESRVKKINQKSDK